MEADRVQASTLSSIVMFENLVEFLYDSDEKLNRIVNMINEGWFSRKVNCTCMDPMDLFHNDVKRGKRDVRRNLIGLERTSIIAEPIKVRVSSWKPRLTPL